MKKYMDELYARLEELSEKPLTLGRIEEADAVAGLLCRLHKLDGMEGDHFRESTKMTEFGVNVPEFYAELARAFLMDKDGPGPEEKLCAYYRCIVKQSR